MCGISGIFEYARTSVMPAEIVERMNDTLRHRGPDDAGVHVDVGVGLGHRRLSIIDVAGGHQPMSNEDGTVWVLLNGEIYNYLDLRAMLASRGHQFRTKSDTEGIAHLYEEFGERCFEHLRGMFAIVIWDSRNRKLLLARDRVGKKPMFYAADQRGILFGSELKAVLAGDSISREVDYESLADYFSFGYVPAPKTIYRAVRKVQPGHYLVASADGICERQYWDISFAETENRSEAEWCDLLRSHLCEATRVRLMSEVPLGAFLSGGVDSSSVVAMMARTSSTPVVTCAIGFPVKEFDESQYARQIAQQMQTEHYEDIVTPNALDVIDKLCWHYDEPFADSSAVPTYYVSRAARQHVTVALGGDGGDENFAGYRRYRFDVFENRMRSMMPAGFRKAVFGPLGKWYPGLAWAPRVFRGKATFQSLSYSPLEGYFNSVSLFRPSEKPKLFTGDLRGKLGSYESISVLQRYYDRAGTDDPLSRIQYVDIKTYLPDDILVKVDRASMAVSLEVRAPYLDHKFMEVAARIPSSLKLRGQEGKYILKKSLEPVLPRDILYRQKQGFGVPLHKWFREDLKDFAYETIFSKPDGLLDQKYLHKIWNEHQSGRFNRSAYLWSVLMFRKWQSIFGA